MRKRCTSLSAELGGGWPRARGSTSALGMQGNGAKEETSIQEKQAQGLRRAVRKGLWQEKKVQDDVMQLWAVVANSLGRQQWARESEWGLLEDVWQVAERWAQKYEAEAMLAKKKSNGNRS